VLKLLGGMGGFPPTTYRCLWHYITALLVLSPHLMGDVHRTNILFQCLSPPSTFCKFEHCLNVVSPLQGEHLALSGLSLKEEGEVQCTNYYDYYGQLSAVNKQTNGGN